MALGRTRARFLLAAVVTALLVGLLTPPAPAAAQSGESRTQLDVRNITPSVVQGGSPDKLTIDGQLTNTSDQRITNMKARLERGSPSEAESAAQQALNGRSPTSAQSSFQPLPDALAPGQSAPFRIEVPMTGPNSLQMTRKGTYPVMLNLNGTVGSGANARVGEGHFTVPVLAAPGGAPAPPPRPTPTSMLVPIVDYPRMEREAVRGERSVFVDDDLADSLRPGGRLHGLVQGVRDGVPPGSPLGDSLCFAIDPAVLTAVNEMQEGYDVRQPDGTLRPGTGGDAARRWTDQLREVTQGRCVFALPYADADIAALGRADLPDLIRGSLESQVVKQTLRVEPRNDLVWPIGEALNRSALDALNGQGTRTALMRPEAIAGPADTLRPSPVRGSNITAQPVDPLLSNAMDPSRGDNPSSTAPSPPETGRFTVQDTLGALAFRASEGSKDGAPTIMAPPRHWNLGAADLRAMFSGMRDLAKAGYIAPTGLPGDSGSTNRPANQQPKLPPTDLTYPATARSEEIPEPVLDALAQRNFKVGDLYRSSLTEPQINIDRAEVTTPLRNALLYGASGAWRGNPGAARYWVDNAADNLRSTLAGVQVASMPQPITRTGSDSKIPVTVSNRLPVTVNVHLRIQPPSGIRIDDLGTLRIPARGSRTFFLASDIQRSGQVGIDVQATTNQGTELGSPTRIQLESSVYGAVTLGITIAASALLLLLSARRVVRRVRASRARSAESPAERTEPIPQATGVDPVADTIEIATTESDRNAN